MTLRFILVCQWCGRHNEAEVPIVAKETPMEATCSNCKKVIVEFSEDAKKCN